jgi:hypothetical protein
MSTSCEGFCGRRFLPDPELVTFEAAGINALSTWYPLDEEEEEVEEVPFEGLSRRLSRRRRTRTSRHPPPSTMRAKEHRSSRVSSGSAAERRRRGS